MSSQKATIVFVPGAWHQPTSFDQVKDLLESEGHTVVYITLPSVGADPAIKNANDDALVLRKVLTDLSSRGTNIMVISHSYGGLVVSNALEGLSAKERSACGKSGGVTANVYISSFVVPRGLTLVDLLPDNKYLPWMRREGDKVIAEDPENYFYHDLAPSTQKKAVDALSWQSAPVYETKATYEPWHTIFSAYLICDQDRAVVPIAQQGMAQALGPTAVIENINTSHSPFLSRPQEVAAFIIKVASSA